MLVRRSSRSAIQISSLISLFNTPQQRNDLTQELRLLKSVDCGALLKSAEGRD